MGGDKRQPLEARVPPVGEDPLGSSGRLEGQWVQTGKTSGLREGRCKALFQDEKPALWLLFQGDIIAIHTSVSAVTSSLVKRPCVNALSELLNHLWWADAAEIEASYCSVWLVNSHCSPESDCITFQYSGYSVDCSVNLPLSLLSVSPDIFTLLIRGFLL